MFIYEIGQVMLSLERKRNGKNRVLGANLGSMDSEAHILPMSHSARKTSAEQTIEIYINAFKIQLF